MVFARCMKTYQKFTFAIEHLMERVFGAMGRKAAERPIATIIVALVLTTLPFAGFARMRFELKMARFMVDQNSQVITNFDRAADEWGDLRQNTFAMYYDDNRNALTTEVVKEIYRFQTATALTDTRYSGVCLNAIPGTSRCSPFSILQYWECIETPCVSMFDTTNFPARLDKYTPLQVLTNRATAVDFQGLPINHRFIFGQPSPSDPTQPLTSAESIATTLPTVRAPGADAGLVEQWEAFFLDYMEDNNPTVQGVSRRYVAQRSEQDEILASSTGSMDLVFICVIIMIGYVCFVFGGVPLTSSRLLLGLAAVANVMQSIMAAFGLAFAIGWPVTPASQLSLFVTLGIGVDGMFVMLTELTTWKQANAAHGRFKDHEYAQLIPEAMEYACAHAGPSVFLSTCTSILAFLTVGSSNFPILRIFTLTTAIALAINYVMMLTFFAACLALDEARVEKQHLDCVPCCVTSEKIHVASDMTATHRTTSQKLFTNFGNFLVKTPVRIAVFIFFAGLLAVGIYGTTELDIKFELSDFLNRGSYATDFQNHASAKFPHLGDLVQFYFKDHDYTTVANQVALRDLSATLKTSPTYFNGQTVVAWYDACLQAATVSGITLTTEGVIPPAAFYAVLTATLNAAPVLKNDVILDSSTGLIARSRFRVEHVPFTKVDHTSNEAMDKAFELADALPFDAYPFTLNYVFEQMYKQVKLELLQNLTIAWAVVTVFLLIVSHPGVAVVMSVILASVEVQLVGFVGLALTMDPVVMSSIVIAIGLAIDYQLHVAHAFWLERGTRPERAVRSLALMGGSVVNAGLSTFLGVAVLLFGRAPAFFTFSLTYLMIILLGELHGIVLLPAILSFIGPKSYSGESHTHAIAPGTMEKGGKGDRSDSTLYSSQSVSTTTNSSTLKSSEYSSSPAVASSANSSSSSDSGSSSSSESS